jgi:large subunit ribosomal protein L10e
MPLRKAMAYSKHRKKAYTRKSNVKSKSYVKAVPSTKIIKFLMGDVNKFNANKFNWIIELRSTELVQIRDNAIEASRQLIHRHLEKQLKGNYYFALSVYPHHVLRENKMLTGAGADRMQTGMSASFGSVVGIAAIVRPGGKIFTIAVSNENDARFVRKVLNKVRAKIPCHAKIIMKRI